MGKRIEGVGIFAVGTWNGQKFTREDLADIAGNTKALMERSNHRPRLKLAHDPDQPLLGEEGDLALGVAANLRVAGDKLIADFVDVPEIVVATIEAGLIRSVSVEMRFIEEFGWVLTAVALLGADLPAVKSLQDLQAYLSLPNQAGHPGEGAPRRLTFSEPRIMEKPVSDPKELTSAERDELRQLRQYKAEQEQQSVVPKADYEQVKAQLTAAQEAQRKSAFSAAKAEAMAPFEQAVKDGRLKPALRDEIAQAFDEQAATFSEKSKLAVPAELSLKLAQEMLPKGESAKDDPEDDVDGDFSDRVDHVFAAKVNELRAKNPQLSYSAAADAVFRADPKLAKRYAAEAPAIGDGNHGTNARVVG